MKNLLILLMIFCSCNGMEQPIKRSYNPEATKKLINLLVPSITEKLAGRYPQFLSKIFKTLRPSWSKEMEALVKQGANPNILLELRERHPLDYRSPLDFALDYRERIQSCFCFIAMWRGPKCKLQYNRL